MKNKMRILTSSEAIDSILNDKIGLQAEITDLALALGGESVDILDHKMGSYLAFSSPKPTIISTDGSIMPFYDSSLSKFKMDDDGTIVKVNDIAKTSGYGIRPVLPLDVIPKNVLRNAKEESGIKVITYGRYPQNIVPETIVRTFVNRALINDGDSFEIGGKYYSSYSSYIEIPSNIKIQNLFNYSDEYKTVYFEVNPVEWYVDEKLGLAISKRVLVAGKSFHKDFNYHFFVETDLCNWLNKTFMKNLLEKDRNERKRNLMHSIDILAKEHIESKNIRFLQDEEHMAVATDFCMLTGTMTNNRLGYYWIEKSNNLFGGESDKAIFIDKEEHEHGADFKKYLCGARPTLKFSSVEEFIDIADDVNEAEVAFGYYPQKVVSKDMQEYLDKMYGNNHMTYACSYTIFGNNDRYSSLYAYELDGKKYVKVKNEFPADTCILSDGSSYKKGESVWTEVTPVIWYLNREQDLLISKKLLFTPKHLIEYYIKDCSYLSIHQFISTYFMPDLVNELFQKQEANEIPFDFNSNVDTRNALISFGLDNDSINDFKERIKSVSDEKAQSLGKELLELLMKYDYDDDSFDAIKLIREGADVTYKDENGDFPLIICAKHNHLKTFISILKAGVDIHETDNQGMNSLMVASKYGYKEIAELAIILGTDVNMKSLDGNSALYYATTFGHNKCSDLLINAGAYINNHNLDEQMTDDDLFKNAISKMKEISGFQKTLK